MNGTDGMECFLVRVRGGGGSGEADLYSSLALQLREETLGGREGGRGRGGGVERIINSFRRRDSCCVVRLNLGPVRLAFTGRDKPPKYRTSQKLTALPRTHRHTHTHTHG